MNKAIFVCAVGMTLGMLGQTGARASAPGSEGSSTNQPPAPVDVQGLRFESWANLGTTNLDTFLSDPRYLTGTPDFRALASAADSRTVYPDDTHDEYGGRLSGFLVPKDSGRYELFLRSQDSSELWLSPNDQTSDLVPVAIEPNCCQPFQETGDPRTSGPITLLAGLKYAIQLVWVAGTGPDYAQIAWRKIGDPTPSAALEPIPGEFLLSSWDPTVGPPQITKKLLQFPGISSNATLTAEAIGQPPLQYQWFAPGGRLLLGATNQTLVVTNVALTNIGSVYTLTLTNALGHLSAHYALVPRGSLFVEAEDFNFDAGHSVTNQAIGLTGAYRGGAYLGKGTSLDLGIDYNVAGASRTNSLSTTNSYRTNTLVTIENRTALSEGLARGQFDVAVNYVISSKPGDWYNYTRSFPSPAVDYYLLGRFATNLAQLRVQIDQVTPGIATNPPTLLKFGEFRLNATNLISTNLVSTNIVVTNTIPASLISLTDTNGQPVVLKGWAGEKTFRATVVAGNPVELDYFLFVPLTPPPEPGTGFTSVTRTGNSLVLAWSQGILEAADLVTGPWTAVPNATSPMTVPIGTGKKFYRIR